MNQATGIGLCSDNVVTILQPSSTIECAVSCGPVSCGPCTPVPLTVRSRATFQADPAGVTTVLDAAVRTDSIVLITIRTTAGTPGVYYVATKTAGQFQVATQIGDTSTYDYIVL